MQNLSMTRRRVLASGLTGALATFATATGASAALPKAAPVDDDLGYLTFAGVAEGVLARAYGNALRVRGAWDRAQRRLLTDIHAQHRTNVGRINASLSPQDLIHSGDFERVVPIKSRADGLRVTDELEALVVGVYLGAAAYAVDPGTRLLLARMLSSSSHNRALLARISGRPPGGLPAPIDLEVAGAKLDSYLKEA